VVEDVEMTTEGPTPIKSDYRESTSLSDVDEIIIWKVELDALTLGDNLSEIYDKFGPSSKKRKRDVDIYGCDSSVSIT